MRASAVLWVSILYLGLVGCKRETPQSAPQPPAAVAIATPAPEITELKREDLVPGSGEALVEGQVAIVHYTGWIYDAAAADFKGAKYDTSRDRPQPYQFTVGAGQVIKGWDLGVIGMQVGAQRRLLIPPDLAYGAAGAPGGVPIPPNAALVLDLELVGIEPASAPPQ